MPATAREPVIARSSGRRRRNLLAVPGWVFPPLEPNFDYRAAIQALAADNLQPVKNQHTVSKVILRGFASTHGPQPGWRLGRYDKRLCRELDPKGLDACGKVPGFVQYASRSAEALWHSVETKLGPAIKSAEAGTLYAQAEQEAAIKDAIALHLVRTPHFRRIHQSSFLESMRAIRQEVLATRSVMLAEEFRRRYGLEPAGLEALEHILAAPLQAWQELEDSGGLFRVGLEQNFYRVRAALQGLRVQVLHVLIGQELLISDSPAFTFRYTPTGNMTVRMAIGDSNGIALPLTRKCLVATSPNATDEELVGDLVDNLNRIQVQIAERQVYYRPSSGLGHFVEQTLTADDSVGVSA